jgi:hypothetical protein
LLSENINKQDIDGVFWENVISVVDSKECTSYYPLFYQKAREAKEAKNKLEYQVYELLGMITSFHLDTDSNNMSSAPFSSSVILNESRSANLEDLSEFDLNLLDLIVENIINAEMRARVADILWVMKRDFKIAALAVNSYLESFWNLIDPEDWTGCCTRIERALQIAVLLGRKNTPYQSSIDTVEQALDKLNGNDPFYLSETLMELLLQYREGDPLKYSNLSESMALQSENDNNMAKARAYWGICARWHHIRKDKDSERKKLICLAETFVKESENEISREKPIYTKASNHLISAIEALRRAGNTKSRIDEIHKVLIRYQKKSVSELIEVSSSKIDISHYVEEAEKIVSNKNLIDALFALGTIGKPQDKSILRTQVEKSSKKFMFQHLFTSVAVNEMGKVIERQPSMTSSNPEEVEAAIRVEMYKKGQYFRFLHTQGLVDPARRKISLDHYVKIQDFYPIVYNNPFVPIGRELIFAQGLQQGINGEFLISSHLLIPQLENSIRHIFYESGYLVSGIDAQGIQDERNLNSLLYLPELEDLLTADITFDLQGLLVERFGSNLRNRMAHGLLDYDQFYSFELEYLWWITLHLCCIYKLLAIKNLS